MSGGVPVNRACVEKTSARATATDGRPHAYAQNCASGVGVEAAEAIAEATVPGVNPAPVIGRLRTRGTSNGRVACLVRRRGHPGWCHSDGSPASPRGDVQGFAVARPWTDVDSIGNHHRDFRLHSHASLGIALEWSQRFLTEQA